MESEAFLQKTIEKRTWRRGTIILPLIIIFVVYLLLASITIFLRPNNDQGNFKSYNGSKWQEQETVYEILIESFKDTSTSAGKFIKEGDGVGDIQGVRDLMTYVEDVGTKIIYLNSFYESNDDDHMTLVNHTKIASVLGSIDDFKMLCNDTQRMEMHVIMDFIPNHTGKGSEWFLKSIEKKEKYTDYYIWAPCDPRAGIYPNNWVSVRGGRAWTYDVIRKECFLHQLEEDKPDLNLWNPDVQQELETILRFWLEKGVDGFHVQNVQYLFEDQDLTSKHNQTRNHPQNAKILQDWKSVLDTYSAEPGKEKALIITADDDLNATLRYIKAGVTMVRINLLSGNGASLAERIENKFKEADSEKKIGWTFSDKYSSRLASKEGLQHTKAILTLQSTLPGVLFNYYGNEIGMTDHPDLPVPLKYRTPMQWNSTGTGFSPNRSWLPRNPNYTTINVETEEAVGNNYTLLKVFKRLQKLRAKESFRSGETSMLRDGDLLMYTRKAEGFPGYLVAINFGNKTVTESFYKAMGIPSQVNVVFHSHKHDNTVRDLSRNSYILDPNQAVVFEYD